MTPYFFMREELEKLCAREVSRGDAVSALAKLKELENTRPTPEQVTRGAVAGGLTGIIAKGAGGLVSGDVAKGLASGLKAPGVGGKLVGAGKALGRGLHGSAAAAASSAAFGASLPVIRSHLDREAEKNKLRTYLGQGGGGRVQQTSKKYLGI